MKKFSFYFLILIFLTFSNYAFSEKIVYANLDKIATTSEVGTKILKFFKNENQKLINEIKAEEIKIREKEKSLITQKNILEEDEVLVRVQKLNYISDLFQGFLSKNNQNEKDVSINRIMLEMQNIKKGVIVIIKDNRGIFEWNKDKKESDNTESQEFREYGVGAQILRDIGVRKMILLTNSKKAIIGLQGFDLKIVGHKEIRNE